VVFSSGITAVKIKPSPATLRGQRQTNWSTLAQFEVG